jgi:hypothetical protein
VRSKVETVSRGVSPNDTQLFTHAEDAFGQLGGTVMTLFFALYTIGETTDAIIDHYSDQTITTQTFGYFLFAMFHVANITIMINMLIAMMTKSYEDTIVYNFLFMTCKN